MSQSSADRARVIHFDSGLQGHRSGQTLFNRLPDNIRHIVAGSYFDPFDHDMTIEELTEWIENHLIFDGNEIIAVFNGDTILWSSQ